MKTISLVLLSIMLFSCGSKSVQDPAEQEVLSTVANATIEVGKPHTVASPARVIDMPLEDGPDATFSDPDAIGEYETYFITIADTGQAYFPLRAEMMRLSKEMQLPIDTMGRYYDAKKNLIVLPENDEDEMFAGDYFPRRTPSQSLSLEYLDLYQDKARSKTIALVSGIYEKKASADSAVAVLKKLTGKAFVVKTNMYVGCLH